MRPQGFEPKQIRPRFCLLISTSSPDVGAVGESPFAPRILEASYIKSTCDEMRVRSLHTRIEFSVQERSRDFRPYCHYCQYCKRLSNIAFRQDNPLPSLSGSLRCQTRSAFYHSSNHVGTMVSFVSFIASLLPLMDCSHGLAKASRCFRLQPSKALIRSPSFLSDLVHCVEMFLRASPPTPR